MSHKVLLVEDAKDMQLIVGAALNNLCELTCTASLAAAMKELEKIDFHLLLLDVNLPDGNGFEFCKKIRAEEKFAELPIIFLTGKTDIEERVLGFELGADDYVTKPFEPQEFIARVTAKLRRHRKKRNVLIKSDFRVDLETQKAWLKSEGEEDQLLNLTPIELRLLVHFLKNESKVLSREDLIGAAWGSDVHVSVHTVDTHISTLRKKIGVYGPSLKAVVRRGYIFSLT